MNNQKRRDFEKRMTEKYPLLYKDMYGDPRETIMAFGFDIGPGWYGIIEDLSPKIEEIIKPMHDEVMANPDTHCARCGRKKQWHWFFYVVYTIKYFFMNRLKAFKAYPQWRRRDKSWGKRDKKLKKSIWKTLYFTLFTYKWYRSCRSWQPAYPKAVQVKEKFGGLRFYMNYYVEDIEKLIGEAESKSFETCEHCGKPGKIREGGWILTLCDECDEMQSER